MQVSHRARRRRVRLRGGRRMSRPPAFSQVRAVVHPAPPQRRLCHRYFAMRAARRFPDRFRRAADDCIAESRCYAIARRCLSRRATPAQPEKMGCLSQAGGVDEARARTPTGGVIAAAAFSQTFSISSICAPSGAATQHTCRPLLTRSSRICAPFFLKFARAPA